MSKKTSSRTNDYIILDKNSPFSAVEAFKAARTNLMFMLDADKEKKSIVFTSFAPMDGKSTTCINLAITFAQTGAKVLLIDADMRKPSIHKYLKIQSKPGLSDVLAGHAGDQPCVYKTEVDNLYFLPSGTIPPNPTELLISDRMDNLLNDFNPLFDYIFVDTPPIGIVTDAAIIGSKTLGVINVVNCEKSKIEDVESIRTSLEQAGVNLIGCILNSLSVNATKKKYRYKRASYGYYGFYGYGYGSNNDYGYSSSYGNEPENNSEEEQKAEE